MITVCVPVLKRYDGLKELILSAERGSIKPDKYFIVDNGGKLDLNYIRGNLPIIIDTYTPLENIGVAKAWNIFIENTHGDIIIANDDVIFHPDTIKGMMDAPGDFVYSSANGKWSMFSLFLIRKSCVEKIGLFDETISPNYGYFEDNDYFQRIELNGTVKYTDCKVPWSHEGSATMKAFSSHEMDEHHRKFKRARDNYIRKWGGLPGKEVFKTPYNK